MLRPKRPETYHHGALKQALLQAAERILEREGIQGLTLRAAAREAGVSHAAPKNHFGDLSGLLSELAAVGFQRFAVMQAEAGANQAPDQRMAAIGRGYVAFARKHTGLFLLMFRSERLDIDRPALRAAIAASSQVLARAVAARRGEAVDGDRLTLPQAAGIVASWALVHGFAMLLLDGRLKPLMAQLPPGTDADALLGAIFAAVKPAK